MQPNPTPGSAREFPPVYVYAVIENIFFFRWEVVYFFADYFPFPVVTMIFLTGFIISSLGKPIHDRFPCLAREKMPHKEEGSTYSINKTQLQNTQLNSESAQHDQKRKQTTLRIDELSLEKYSCC